MRNRIFFMQGFQGFKPGKQLTLNGNAQYTISQTFSTTVGIEGRFGQQDEFYGQDDANSGGAIAYGVIGLVGKWWQSGVWHIKGQFAINENLKGDHKEPFVLYAGLSYGF